MEAMVESSEKTSLNCECPMQKPIVRFKPIHFIDIVSTLSPEQRDWVVRTGLGPVMYFNLKEYPLDISYMLLDCYEPNPSAMRLNDHFFQISEADVNQILGLPNGEEDIYLSDERIKLKEWLQGFNGQPCKQGILASELCTAIKENKYLDEKFKWNFLVLMCNTLVEGSTTPYVNTDILQFTGNLDQCYKYNWCKHLLLCLQEDFVQWKISQGKSYFKGSLAFIFFYGMDRLIMKKRGEQIVSPTYLNMTNNVLSSIQKMYSKTENKQFFADVNVDEVKTVDMYTSNIIKQVCDDINRDYKDDADVSPDIGVTYLNEALEEYTRVQDKLMEDFNFAATIFPSSDSVHIMRAKFVTLNEKAIRFVSKFLVEEEHMRKKKTSGMEKDLILEKFENFKIQEDRELKELWNIIISNDLDENIILFKWRNVIACKSDFQSLKSGEMLLSTIIDVFSCLLGIRNKSREAGTLMRVFCFTENTLGIVNASEQISYDVLYAVFEENLDNVLNMYGISVHEIDMIFFPMLNLNHYYLVSYNLKKPSFEILDNRKSDKANNILYGSQIDKLHKHFTSYLSSKGFSNLMGIKFLVPERLIMSWQTVFNDVDCGVFVMYHMETYFGGGPNNWNSCLGYESYDQLKNLEKLRGEYLRAILLSSCNENRHILLKYNNGAAIDP